MKEKNLKSQFLLVISLSLTGCFDIKGDDVAVIYPSEGIANIRQFTNSCPVQVTQAKTINVNDLDGWFCVPPDKASKYRREYEKDNNCN